MKYNSGEKGSRNAALIPGGMNYRKLNIGNIKLHPRRKRVTENIKSDSQSNPPVLVPGKFLDKNRKTDSFFKGLIKSFWRKITKLLRK